MDESGFGSTCGGDISGGVRRVGRTRVKSPVKNIVGRGLLMASAFAMTMAAPLAVGGGFGARYGAGAAQAEVAPATANVADLEESLQITELFGVLSREGHEYGTTLNKTMLGGKGGLRWQAAVSRIYEPSVLQARFSRAFVAALKGQPEAVSAAQAFFASPPGQRIVALERGARETLMDADAKEAAEVEADKLRDARAPRLRLIRDLIEAGDLIESNVASGLTGSAAFSEALAATQPEAQRLPEEERMAQVWRQEGEIRASTTSWLLTLMVLAYGPLSDEELQSWIDFSKSDAGRAVNRALFTAYGETFRVVMSELGTEAGLILRGSQI